MSQKLLMFIVCISSILVPLLQGGAATSVSAGEAPIGAAALEIHVAPNGNDGNPGTALRPLATLIRARDMARALRAKQGDGPIKIILHNGEYRLDRTMVLTPQDSDTAYIAAPGEKPVVTSAKEISGWQPLEDSTAPVSSKANGHIWTAPVPVGWRFHFLYVDGRPAKRSRSTEEENWRNWGGRSFSFGRPKPEGQLVTFQNKAELQNLPQNGDVEMFCILYQFGVEGNGVLTEIDPEKGTALWHSKQLNLENARGGAETDFRLENALPFISEPGEWAVDSKAGKVYYWPRNGEDMARVHVTAPTLNELVRLQGDDAKGSYVSHVRLDGITFNCTDRLPEDQWPDAWTFRQWENPDAMIFAEGIEDCAVVNCHLYYSGSYGVALYRHAQRNKIIGCEIGWTGSGGVELFGFGAGFRDENHDNIVRRNYIHDHGLANYWHSPNVQIFGSGNNWVDHNFLAMSAYNNVSITGVPWDDLNNWKGIQEGPPAQTVDNTCAFAVDFSTYPKDVLEKVKAGQPYFTPGNYRELAIHSRNNKIWRNIAVECQSRLEEGGALYAWHPGKGNQYVENVIYKSSGMPGSSVIGMDDHSEYANISGNVVWVEGNVLNVVGQRPYTQGTTINDNVRVKYPPTIGGTHWWVNESGRESFDALYKTIKGEVDAEGGWPGNPDLDAWIDKREHSPNHFELTPDEVKKMHKLM